MPKFKDMMQSEIDAQVGVCVCGHAKSLHLADSTYSSCTTCFIRVCEVVQRNEVDFSLSSRSYKTSSSYGEACKQTNACQVESFNSFEQMVYEALVK